ncbi:TRAP transporter solute receptor [Rhodovulum sp. PH10]|uniref:TRAP transporter substrate-binding protein n=1 Tax=Rhodovulum sp. PH10 TaxID=1187851 RepID=UPI00027C2AB6|nr:TRAP transporter substrate-binding protein [Rhodovulum sp. PH10]EJW10089.1 TRAP transporter solute receptor [Rhodovulum sp. PH10]
MTRTTRRFALAAATGFAVGLAFAGTAAAQTSWDMPTPYPSNNFHTENIVVFAQDVETATGGKLKITVHPGGSLIKHAEIKRAVRQGIAPIGEVIISLAANESPVYAVDSLPFLATGYEASRKLYAAQKPYLEKRLDGEGLKLLWSEPWPPQGLYSKREIKSVDDLKGLKFRTYNAVIGRIAALAGAIPVQIEVPDLPTAFATGRVDVMITSASTGVDTKAQDYLSHYNDIQAWLPRDMVFVNKSAFARLSDAEKKAVLEAAAAAEERGWKASRDEMNAKNAALKAAGIVFQDPAPELKAGFDAIGKTITDEWLASAGADGKAILDAYRAGGK